MWRSKSGRPLQASVFPPMLQLATCEAGQIPQTPPARLLKRPQKEFSGHTHLLSKISSPSHGCTSWGPEIPSVPKGKFDGEESARRTPPTTHRVSGVPALPFLPRWGSHTWVVVLDHNQARAQEAKERRPEPSSSSNRHMEGAWRPAAPAAAHAAGCHVGLALSSARNASSCDLRVIGEHP